MCICADVQHVQRNINNINQGTYFFSTARRRVYILIINVIKEIKDMKKKSNKKGFTIMEMLIVVAIIAVLAAIAIPTFNGALTKSKEAADIANIRAAYAEVTVAYLTDNTAYPTDKDAFLAKVDGGKLNYNDKLTKYAAPTAAAKGEIVYTATKLTNKDSNDHVFKWTFDTSDIN